MRGKADYYRRLAKQKGYPARSVFKLQEMQDKFHFLRRGSRILDIGMSPGSWTLYAAREIGARVVGVDKVRPDKEVLAVCRFLEGDIFDPAVCGLITEQRPYHAVISDAAPSTTGARLVDTARSHEIGEQVIRIGLDNLLKGGCCIVKLFQGGRESELRERMKSRFSAVQFYKPEACRKNSYEIYLLGRGFI